jgi:hypothetical protein
MNAFSGASSSSLLDLSRNKDLRRALRQQGYSRRNNSAKTTAMAIPGYGLAEQVFVGGFGNFLSIVSFCLYDAAAAAFGQTMCCFIFSHITISLF